MAWTTPTTLGTNPTAALLNQQIRDNFKAIGNPWTSYTPTWTATTTNPTIGNGTLHGFYVAAGKLILGRFVLIFGSTTTVGSGSYRFTLPVTALDPGQILPIGTVDTQDSSTGDHTTLYALMLTTTTFSINSPVVKHNSPYAWGTGDHISGTFYYEAA